MVRGTSLIVVCSLGYAVSLCAAPESGTSRALIVVGLPGDVEHEKLFAQTVATWRDWLTKRLDFAPGEVRVLALSAPSNAASTIRRTRKAVEKEVAGFKKKIRKEDRLWVFFLGHADYDREHARFHIPGPDLRDIDMGKLFEGIRCREQVFWLTMSASGWFLRHLSAKGRVVVTATAADEEYNETEFPHALSSVVKRPHAHLDANRDGKVSVLELFNHTNSEVAKRFAADKRIPTEHAQLDDNGDGVGTERPVAIAGQQVGGRPADGALAARIFLSFRNRKTVTL